MNKFAIRSFRPAAIGAALLSAVAAAHAELPAGAAAAITTYQTDVVTAVGLVIAAGIAIYAVRKLGQKMGWL